MESHHYIYNSSFNHNESVWPYNYHYTYGQPDYDWDYFYIEDDNHYEHSPSFQKYMNYQKIRRIVFGILLIGLIGIGLFGNIIVIFTSGRKCRHINSAFYAFLINLCVASMVLLAFEYPLLLYENVFTQPWKMGRFFCQLHGYIQYCAFYGTAYALVMVIVFRLLQVIIPDRIVIMNNTCTASVICSIQWAIIMIANIPTWIGHGLYDEIEGRSFCYHKQLHESKDRLHSYLTLHFIFAFAFPCVLMVAIAVVLVLNAMHLPTGSQYGSINGSNQFQRNTTFMLIGLITAFIVCWGPTNVYILLLGFEYLNFDEILLLSIISDIFMTMACSNPCINPWLILLALKKELIPNQRSAVRVQHHNHANGDVTADTNITSNGDVCHTEYKVTDQGEDYNIEMNSAHDSLHIVT